MPSRRTTYEHGLHELGDGLFAYLQPDGGWGWSNAGLVTTDDGSLLVDTLFDLSLTREMLRAMRGITSTRPIGVAVNTHGNGDHCFGNQLLPASTRIVASAAAVADMREAPPERLQDLVKADLAPELADYLHRIFAPFRFDGIELRLPDQVFEGELEIRVGARLVRLVELGPAHTSGDAVAYVPDAGVAFTGDILFVGGTPIVWAGPVSRWLSACDHLLASGAELFVPGHGPVTDRTGVQRMQGYLRFVRDQAAQRHAAGMSSEEAAQDIELGEFGQWTDCERIAVNVHSVYRELDPKEPELSVPDLFGRMARWQRRRGRAGGRVSAGRPR